MIIIYTHQGIRRKEESDAMQLCIESIHDHPLVEKIILAEFGEGFYSLGEFKKLQRFRIPYTGIWRAGLMRNVGFALSGAKGEDICFFADTDVAILPEAIKWADGTLRARGNLLLQFPRSDIMENVSLEMFSGKREFLPEKLSKKEYIFDSNCENKGEQAIRAEDFSRVGGFDCEISGWGYYDFDFFRMSQVVFGLEVEYCPSLGTWHFGHPGCSPEDRANNKRNETYSKQKINKMLEQKNV